MNDFPHATREMWRARVGDIEKLTSHTADGIRIEPLYHQVAAGRVERSGLGPWQVVQRMDHPNAAKANAQALDDLANGATGLAIARDFDARMLEGVALHAIHMRLEGGDEQARAFAAFVARQPIDPARLGVTFSVSDETLIKDLQAQGFAGPFIAADGRTFHNQGATEAQELASVLLVLADALRRNVAVSVTLAANQDMFMTLAKFRALRYLWARALEANGLPFRALPLHAETSLRMMAVLDPHSNMLRNTTAVFGAALGGADSITVLPFSVAQGESDAMARRMARNCQLILQEESQLWRVSDAAAGSGYVETLTRGLCEKAWEIYQSGEMPEFDNGNANSAPIIGTMSYRLSQEFAPAVEKLP